jgi:hypothetical protein
MATVIQHEIDHANWRAPDGSNGSNHLGRTLPEGPQCQKVLLHEVTSPTARLSGTGRSPRLSACCRPTAAGAQVVTCPSASPGAKYGSCAAANQGTSAAVTSSTVVLTCSSRAVTYDGGVNTCAYTVWYPWSYMDYNTPILTTYAGWQRETTSLGTTRLRRRQPDQSRVLRRFPYAGRTLQ